jgi:hypothetical protein
VKTEKMELITKDDLKAKIFTIRGIQVMLDRDLALLYGVQTKVLNQAIKRNKERFPELFDAYVFANDLIKSAKQSIILIDNYIDETTLLMLSKRNPNCKAIIYTSKISSQLQLDLAKHNEQYPTIEIKQLKTSHDRFLILDEKELYHLGASLKDLGKKWFAFSKLNEFLPEVLARLKL